MSKLNYYNEKPEIGTIHHVTTIQFINIVVNDKLFHLRYKLNKLWAYIVK